MTALDQMAASFEAAYNTQDAASVGALYEQDAQWMSSNGKVFVGRAAIEDAVAEFFTIAPPRLKLNEQARVMSGRHAVSRGTYRLTDDESGFSLGGAYLNVLRREAEDEGGWKVLSQQMNLDVGTVPGLWAGDREDLVALPHLGTLVENLGFSTVDVVARDGTQAWTPDAQVALPGTTWVIGPPSISGVLRAASRTTPVLVMHDLGTLQLDGGLAVDVGWYDLELEGAGRLWGTYSLLARWVPRGEWLIHWLVATASPGSDDPPPG
jgi:uncharacterized protein (TIGR02246 family)